MIRRRGAPVFLELMRPDRSALRPPHAPAPAPLFDPARRPPRPTNAAVETKPAQAPASVVDRPASAAGLEARGRDLLGQARAPWLLVAAACGAVLVVWLIAYAVGYRSAEDKYQQVISRMGPEDDPPARPVVPPPGPAAAQSEPPVQAAPAEAAAPAGVVDQFLKGYNYLVVATLMKRDADDAREYLARNGVPTILKAVGQDVDPDSPQANNVQWYVVVLKGYSSSEYRARESERTALATRVQALGRTWKLENKKAPADFSQVLWWKFKD